MATRSVYRSGRNRERTTNRADGDKVGAAAAIRRAGPKNAQLRGEAVVGAAAKRLEPTSFGRGCEKGRRKLETAQGIIIARPLCCDCCDEEENVEKKDQSHVSM
jgi:hypothetical protein